MFVCGMGGANVADGAGVRIGAGGGSRSGGVLNGCSSRELRGLSVVAAFISGSSSKGEDSLLTNMKKKGPLC